MDNKLLNFIVLFNDRHVSVNEYVAYQVVAYNAEKTNS